MARFQKRYTTIEEMEAQAKLEEDGTTNRRIGEHWLEVKFELSDRDEPSFQYFWMAVSITRKEAVETIERAMKTEGKTRVRDRRRA